jgi:hypothetical protein
MTENTENTENKDTQKININNTDSSISIGTGVLKTKKSLRPGRSIAPNRSWRPNPLMPMVKINIGNKHSQE